MNKTQRIIVVLLILAIVFSGISIIVSFSAANLQRTHSSVSGNVVNGGAGVNLVVERSPSGGNNG